MVKKILIVGSGARENVMLQKLIASKTDLKIYLYNYHYSIEDYYNKFELYNKDSNKINKYNLDNISYIIDDDDCESIIRVCTDKEIGLVIPGSEKYLVNGLVNKLARFNIKCYGPTENNARLEGDKNYGKQIMEKYNLDIPKYKTFNYNEYEDCIDYVSKIIDSGNGCVIKENGLASGKGVFIPQTFEDALDILKSIIVNKHVYDTDNKIVIENKLYGEEVSLMGFCNGIEIQFSPQSQDYKRKGDGNNGPNTGGMGSICPVNNINKNWLEELKIKLDKLVKDTCYIGVLYIGCMFPSPYCSDDQNPKIIEFNCRLGDPEAQVVLGCLKTDLYEVIYNSVNMLPLNLEWDTEYKFINIVVADEYYSEKISLSDKRNRDASLSTEINFDKFINVFKKNENMNIYFANVKQIANSKDNGETIKYSTSGGRVLSVCIKGNSWQQCHFQIYNMLAKLYFEKMYYRRDIAELKLVENFEYKYNKLNTYKLGTTEMYKPKIAILSSSMGRSCYSLIDNYKRGESWLDIGLIISNRRNSGILSVAKKNGITHMYVNSTKYNRENYDRILVNVLRSFGIDLVLLVGYNKIVSPVLINEYKENIVNIHPSLLPKYGGKMDLDIHNLVIKNKEKYTGCTLHVVNEGVDEGAIIIQSQLAVNNINNSETLKEKVQLLERNCIETYIKMKVGGGFKIDYDVNIELGNKFTEELKKENSDIGGFCSFFEHSGIEWGSSCDGVGTKLDLAIKCGDLTGIGIDLVAMSINDLLVCGVKPLYFLDYIAIDNMNLELCNKIIASIKKGCELADCKLIGGETAEMKGIYQSGKFDLAGFGAGVVVNKLPKLDEINEECVLYGIESNGVHSNGYTLINKLLKLDSSIYDIDTKELNLTKLRLLVDNLGLLKPTRIYTELLKMYEDEEFYKIIKGAVHITGGGFEDNICRVLPDGYDFFLTRTIMFSDVFRWIQGRGSLQYSDMLKIYNCGIGIVLVIMKNEETKFTVNNLVKKYNLIELGKVVKKTSSPKNL